MTIAENHRFPAGRTAILLTVLMTILFGLVLVRTAWISDDAYITLRTVDNFTHGHGLTWNVDERVQAYTDPLWMFMLSGLYAITHEAFYTAILASVVVSLCAFWLTAKAASGSGVVTLAALSALILSKAFVDYSTSGLENPLTHLLLALFLLIFLRHEAPFGKLEILTLSLIAGLAVLNRMDMGLLFAPALLYLLLNKRWRGAAGPLAVGFVPVALWEAFSIVYYGFPFPNTAYAKLNTGLPRSALLQQGIQYFLNSLRWDPLTLIIVAAGLVLSFRRGSTREKMIAAGVGLYLLYVWSIGGDFMSGRFFTAALLAAVVLLARRMAPLSTLQGLGALAVVLVLGMLSPNPTLNSIVASSFPKPWMDGAGISDERAYYFPYASLAYARSNSIEPHTGGALAGLALRSSATTVTVGGSIGCLGYFAGPGVHIIDVFGLGDPLLSRLPPRPEAKWRIGHLSRTVPPGYLESVDTGEDLLKNDGLASYYAKLRLVTRGPIWSLRRFAVIWALNTGQADHLIAGFKP